MSEYQYYEFCRLNSPLSAEARKEMSSLSSRSRVGTHGASYVYHYGDFRDNPKKLVLKYFDVFFYISNFGTIRLLFKYLAHQINVDEIKKYGIKNVIYCEQDKENFLLEISISHEEGFGWTEGEGVLADLLPLYDEIKDQNYQFLRLISAINDQLSGETKNLVSAATMERSLLTAAQQAFLECLGIDSQVIHE